MVREQKKFMDIYYKYKSYLISSLVNKVSPDTAEDLVHEVFITYYQKINQVEKPRQWLIGTLKNELLNYYKKSNMILNDGIDIFDINEDVVLSFLNAFKDTRIIIEETIKNSGMTELEETIFNMIAYYNYTRVKAAEALGITERKIRYYFKKATHRIRSYLKEKGINNIEDLL